MTPLKLFIFQLSILILISCSCQQHELDTAKSNTKKTLSQDSLILQLWLQKKNIDSLKNGNFLIKSVFVKTKGLANFRKLDSTELPSLDTESMYITFKDSSEKILSIEEYPIQRKKGNPFFIFLYYFDQKEKTFALQKQTIFSCKDRKRHDASTITEYITEYFSKDFNVVNQTYSLKDIGGNEADKNICKAPNGSPYKAKKSLKEFLEKNK